MSSVNMGQSGNHGTVDGKIRHVAYMDMMDMT